jgi:hypothetical protein
MARIYSVADGHTPTPASVAVEPIEHKFWMCIVLAEAEVCKNASPRAFAMPFNPTPDLET